MKALQAQMESERAANETQREKLERQLVTVSPELDTLAFSEHASIYSEKGTYRSKHVLWRLRWITDDTHRFNSRHSPIRHDT